MYKLFDGDYDIQYSEQLEILLTEKLGETLSWAKECAISNAYDIKQGRHLFIVVDNGISDEDWDDDVSIPLTDDEIALVLETIPDPGHGPYFYWEIEPENG